MPTVPDTPAADAPARLPLSTAGLRPTDINPDDMDEIIMRIFKELRKQFSQMESKKADELTTPDRERHARILSNLERTMERLAQVEAGRAAQRQSAKEQDHDALFEQLHNRISRAVRREIQRTSSDRAEGTRK